MRRFLIALSLVAMLGAPVEAATDGRSGASLESTSSVPAIDWTKDDILKYFWHPTGELKLPLRSDTWRGAKSLGQVGFVDYPVGLEGPPEYVWAPLCKPGEQKVQFTREILLPGVPADFRLSAGFYPGSPANAIEHVDVSVNGAKVFSTTREVHKQKAGGSGPPSV
jgi:hypothetical protein